jgi:hypothetical protein
MAEKVFFFNRKVTVSDGLLRCLKKGSGEEQALSAKCLSLLCIQLGNEIEEDFKDVHSLLLTIISDTTAPVKAQSVLLVEETRVSRENHLPDAGHRHYIMFY